MLKVSVRFPTFWRTCLTWVGLGLGALLWGGCALLPMVGQGGDRTFLEVELEPLARLSIPPQTVVDTTGQEVRFGGVSALAYDRRLDRLYALSDEHNSGLPSHVFTLRLNMLAGVESSSGVELKDLRGTIAQSLLESDSTTHSPSASDPDPDTSPSLARVQFERVIWLTTDTPTTNQGGDNVDALALDAEGLALTPQGTLWVSSEGRNPREIPPKVQEFEAETGHYLRDLTIPPLFTMAIDPKTRRQQAGIQSNQGFEALTLAPATTKADPLRLFTANESPLVQDLDLEHSEEGGRLRFLHYYLGDGPPLLLAQHLYTLAPVPLALVNGLSDVLALDTSGHFLTLERALTPFGFEIQLFETTLGGASDISGMTALQGELTQVQPMAKRSVLNFKTANLPLTNWEGMTWGPQLPDGSPSILVVSDNNFGDEATQVLLLRLRQP